MYTVLLLALIFSFLLEPAAAAATPTMDFALPGSPMDPFPHDFEVLNPLCELCAMPFFQCLHAMVRVLMRP